MKATWAIIGALAAAIFLGSIALEKVRDEQARAAKEALFQKLTAPRPTPAGEVLVRRYSLPPE